MALLSQEGDLWTLGTAATTSATYQADISKGLIDIENLFNYQDT
jgi:hypothetical protein